MAFTENATEHLAGKSTECPLESIFSVEFRVGMANQEWIPAMQYLYCLDKKPFIVSNACFISGRCFQNIACNCFQLCYGFASTPSSYSSHLVLLFTRAFMYQSKIGNVYAPKSESQFEIFSNVKRRVCKNILYQFLLQFLNLRFHKGHKTFSCWKVMIFCKEIETNYNNPFSS